MRLALASLSLSLLLAGAAEAGPCAPPRLLNSVPFDLVRGAAVVAATLDRHPVKFQIDTGSVFSQMARTPAASLGLTELELSHGQFDISGRFSNATARVTSMSLANMEATGFYVWVSPDPNDAAEPAFDGILATDMMTRYDIDFDFAHRRMNYFTPEACERAGVYWAPKALAVLPMPQYPGRPYVEVTLDGKKIRALIDTGSDHSMMNPVSAQRLFGLEEGSAGTAPGEVVSDGAVAKADFHTFATLSLGGITLKDVAVAIVRDRQTERDGEIFLSRAVPDRFPLHRLLPELTLGMDVLSRTHLYISFQDRLAYVSAAEDGEGALPAMAAPNKLTVWPFGYENLLHPFVRY